MKKEELKMIVSISVGMSVSLAFLIIFLSGEEIKIANTPKFISSGVSITTLFWVFYFSHGWRWPVINLIFYRPDLNGTWSGVLVSDWKDEFGKSIPPKIFHMVIRQSFLRIHFTTFTDNYVGVSYAETFSLKKDKGLKNVAYLYRKETSQNNDEVLQEGATELRLVEAGKKILQGKYWSNRKTNGSIKVYFVSKKHVDSYEEALKLGKND